MTTAKSACRYPECGRPVKAVGLCGGHYLQRSRGAQLSPLQVRRPATPCSVEGCDDRARQFNSGQPLCTTHHMRWRKHGDATKITKGLVVTRGKEAIADAVINRDRSECWTDWSDLPCWEGLDGWGGGYQNGYPTLGRDVKVMWLSMEVDGRPRPEAPDNYGLHSCDDTACWNPSHLRWGSHIENMGDRIGKQNYCRHCSHCNPAS